MCIKANFVCFIKVYILINLGIFMLHSKNGILIYSIVLLGNKARGPVKLSCFFQKIPLLGYYSKVETMERDTSASTYGVPSKGARHETSVSLGA